MNIFSLRTIIDDILLMVRNNNISESEDFSRMLIASWILSYRAAILKEKLEKDKKDNQNDPDESLVSTKGPVELITEKSQDDTCSFRKRTKEKINLLNDDSTQSLISVSDQDGCVIQFMHEKRRHYHYFRKYTFGELTCWYENGYLYVEGLTDLGLLQYLWITGVFLDEDDENASEDSVKIPGWMIPEIKKRIMSNELSFMLKLPSDDSNNSTLDGIKPVGPAENEK